MRRVGLPRRRPREKPRYSRLKIHSFRRASIDRHRLFARSARSSHVPRQYLDIINPGEEIVTSSQDAAVLHGKEGPVQQVHNQRCQRIRGLGSWKEHAITNHHTAALLAHRGVGRTPCCTRYAAFRVFRREFTIRRH